MKEKKPAAQRKDPQQAEEHRHAREMRILFHSSNFQRGIAFALAVMAVFFCVSRGTMPKRYRLTVGQISEVDIIAPRDIVNAVRTRLTAEEKAAALPAVIIENAQAGIEITNHAHQLLNDLSEASLRVRAEMAAAEASDAASSENGVPDGADTSGGAASDAGGSTGGTAAVDALFDRFASADVQPLLGRLSEDQLAVLAQDAAGTLALLKTMLTQQLIPDYVSHQVTDQTLSQEKSVLKARLSSRFAAEPWRTVGAALLDAILVPNSSVDEAATESQRQQFAATFVRESPVVIYKDERILNRDDIVTEDIWQVLKELNYIEQEGGADYGLYASVLALVLALAFTAFFLLRRFDGRMYRDAHMVALLATCVVIGSFMVWLVKEFMPGYAAYLMPVSVVPVLLATLIGLESAIIVNFALTMCFAVMLGGNVTFLLTAFISGTLAAFLTHNASQRRRISMAGVAIGVANVVVVILTGIISKKGLDSLVNEGGLSLLNGLVSMVIAIGLLPFFETTFNVITPFKLQELADPNHPLLKRLLIEAPGTWHHSLMVGNLAEAATRAIGGNVLLSRVGAYFHDVGKLKRPNFFKENQMINENPHERLTPSLSTLIITSHPKDGDELATKYRLPKPIRDIILQHHGQTLVAYFYHKALSTEKGEVKMDAFRYEGPKPDTREAAVVLLADSVEAAVRSMQERTRGKTEGMVRKIIKDKLDDGQLDRCDLSLRDLGLIADSFMQVLGGIFHERPEYPEMEKKNPLADLDNKIYNLPAREPVAAERSRVAGAGSEPAHKTGGVNGEPAHKTAAVNGEPVHKTAGLNGEPAIVPAAEG